MSVVMGGEGAFKTDDRGIYRFTGLPAGEYLVKVTENVEHSKGNSRNSAYAGFESLLFGTDSMVTVFFQNAFEKENAELVKLELGQELSEINITLPERELKNVKGKVVAAKDKLPVRNARVTISREGEETVENEYRPTPRTTYTDSKGNWEFLELPRGKYKISVQAESSEYDDVAKAYGANPEDRGYAGNYATIT